MITTYILLLLVTLNCYSSLSGFKDSILWSGKGAEAFTWNEHLVFALERGAIVGAAAISTQISFIQTLGTILGFLLMFSLVHNQSYYYGRHLIDGTPFQWKYTSSTSTARFTLTYPIRLGMFILGLLVSILTIVFTQ